MIFTAFRSLKGDCILISNNDDNSPGNILIDGGKKSSFESYTLPYLYKELTQKGESIDLLCVSHIDDDHIAGILALMLHMAAWKAKKYHEANNNPPYKPSLKNEPPPVKLMWHNSFAQTYGLPNVTANILQTLNQIELLTATASSHVLQEVHEKTANERQGIALSQFISPEQLNIPVNSGFRGKIIKCNQSTIAKNVRSIAGVDITILGPFHDDLMDLRERWINWEDQNQMNLKDYLADFTLSSGNLPLTNSDLLNLLINSGSVSGMGNEQQITIPNLASITFLVEKDGKSILMTGDASAQDIMRGLDVNDKLDQQNIIHIDILKVQHHGAEANINVEFCNTVIAEHYVFCGNGTHHNPEISVAELIFTHRKEVDKPFTFHFTANPDDRGKRKLTAKQKVHMKALKERLQKIKDDNPSIAFNFEFIGPSSDFVQIVL